MATETTSTDIGLYERIRIAEQFAERIIWKDQLQSSVPDLRIVLNAPGSNPTAVLSNWIYGLILNESEHFHDDAQGLSYVENMLRRRILEAFPDAYVV